MPYVLDHDVEEGTAIVPVWLASCVFECTDVSVELTADDLSMMPEIKAVSVRFKESDSLYPPLYSKDEIQACLLGKLLASGQLHPFVIDGGRFVATVTLSDERGIVGKNTRIDTLVEHLALDAKPFEAYADELLAPILADIRKAGSRVHLKNFYAPHQQHLSHLLRLHGMTVVVLEDWDIFEEEPEMPPLLEPVTSCIIPAPVRRLEKVLLEQPKPLVLLLSTIPTATVGPIERFLGRLPDLTAALLQDNNPFKRTPFTQSYELTVRNPLKVMRTLLPSNIEMEQFAWMLAGMPIGMLHSLALETEVTGDFSAALDRYRALLVEQNSFCRMLLIEKPSSGNLWPGIGGYEQVKRMLARLLYSPLEKPVQAATLGITLPPGILLHGPAGCGKHTFIRALASHRRFSVLHVLCPLLFARHLGETEENIRALFAQARSMSPCILFLDQIETVGISRSIIIIIIIILCV